MATGARNQQTGQAGENFVAAELNRRGAYAVTFSGTLLQKYREKTIRSCYKTGSIVIRFFT